MKRVAIVVFSLLMIHAGIAWAIEACLEDDHHAEHAKPRSDSRAFVSHSDSQDPSVPVLHCTSVSQEIGPMARVALAEIPRSSKVIPLEQASLHGAFSAALGNGLWLDAVFRRIVTISLPINLSRHLFLSVLQV